MRPHYTRSMAFPGLHAVCTVPRGGSWAQHGILNKGTKAMTDGQPLRSGREGHLTSLPSRGFKAKLCLTFLLHPKNQGTWSHRARVSWTHTSTRAQSLHRLPDSVSLVQSFQSNFNRKTRSQLTSWRTTTFKA